MYIFIKRIFDIFLAIVLIILLIAPMLLISLLVKLDSKGPILFQQKRVGKAGKTFTILKFRTMILNAESMGTGLDSFKGDNRVTKIGKVLRDSSLDELPQLFNILIGDMSFVGPRPPVTYSPYKYEDYPESVKKRFVMKPGVTGLAQINGRNNLDWDEKFKYDIEYVDKVSFLLDLKIMILTGIKVIKNEGAYDSTNK